MKVVQLLIFVVLFALGAQAMAQSLPVDAVGEVVFSIGRTQARMGAGETVEIKAGDPVFVTQTLSTSPGGHLHLRMRDGAFLSLRPDSVVTIAQYALDAAVPNNNQIRLEVHKGGVRSVTGAAGQANKAGFRLNTPVAAIGIRGTDFTVFTDNLISSVSVLEGGVVVSPFTSACSRTALGACGGVQSVVLSAYDQQMVAEVAQQQASLIKKVDAKIVPDEIKPAHPAENESLQHVKDSSTNTSSVASSTTQASASQASDQKSINSASTGDGKTSNSESTANSALTEKGKADPKATTTTKTNGFGLVSAGTANNNQTNNSDATVSVAPLMPITADVGPKASVTSELASRIIAESGTGYTLKEIGSIANTVVNQPVSPPATTPPSVVTPTPAVPVSQSQPFYWGRWNAYAENDAQAILRDPVRNKQIFTNNAVHVLATTEKTQGVMPSPTLPSSGVVEFAMDKGEAVVVVAEKIRAANISNPKLTVNFDTSRFNTSLDVNSAALTNGTAHLNAEGTLGKTTGLLASSLNTSTMNVSGALSRNGSQAGYVFEQPSTGISGATSWQVEP